MGIPEACRVMDTLGQAEHFLPQLSRGLELHPCGIERHKALQHGEELRGLSHLL